MNVRVLQPRLPSAVIRMLLAVVILLGAGLPMTAMGQQEGEKVLTGGFDVGPGGCPECFNPLQATAGFTWLEKYYSKLILYQVTSEAQEEGIADIYAQETELQGELAESWDISEDGLEYTLHLRDGVTWHDGEPFTSADVRFSIELVQNPDSSSWLSQYFTTVSSVETPDDLTAVIVQSEPNAAILDSLTFLSMLPAHLLSDIPAAELATSDWWYTNPVGTGPFVWSDYAEGQYVELVAYDDYWRGRPKIDRLVNRFFPEAGSAVLAMRSGEIQFTYLNADEAADFQDAADASVIAGPSQVSNSIVFNTQKAPFDNPLVRQAFMYAIDREAIVESLYMGSATVLNCDFSNQSYIPDGINEYPYDPDKARELLDEAGFTQDGPIDFFTHSGYGDQVSQDMMLTIQQYLADVGVDVEIRVMDIPAFRETTTTTSDWDFFYAGAANGPDPAVTRTYFDSQAIPPAGNNQSKYANDQMDALYAQGQTETDPTARAGVYQDICAFQNEQVPWAFLWVTDRFGVVSNNVENFVWTPAPGGGRYYDAAQEWDIPAS